MIVDVEYLERTRRDLARTQNITSEGNHKI